MQALDYFKGNLFRLYIKTGGSGSGAISSELPPGQHNIPENIPQSGNSPSQEQRGQFHPGIICDGCNGPIYGARFKCMTCSDYDLCSICEGKGIHVDHSMVELTQPVNSNSWMPPFSSGYLPFFGGYTPFTTHPHSECGGFSGAGFGCGGRRGRKNPFGGGWGHRNPFRGGWGRKCGEKGGPGDCPGRQSEKPKKGQGEAGEAGPEPMDTEQKGRSSKEDQKDFLKGLGDGVSKFLEPFGLKVDVGVLGGGGNCGGTSAEPKADSDTPSGSSTTVSSSTKYLPITIFYHLVF